MYDMPCSRSILIIDDDDALRRSIVGFLEDTGFEVHQACSGQEGIKIFTELNPDLVLTDLMMPELDGLGVVNAIKQHSPDTPVVVISGNGSVGYAIETMRQGAWDYITKPIHDFSVLERTINTVTTRADEVQAARKRMQELERTADEHAAQLQGVGLRDSLTGLPTRKYLHEIFSTVLLKPDFPGNLFVMLLDLDNLKSVNKTLGHETGDLVLVETANRLQQLQTEKRIIGRLGADQFVIMVIDCHEVHICIAALRQLLSSPYIVSSGELFMTGCIGISVFPHDGESMDSLLQNANAALSQAKLMGTNRYSFYSKELGAQLRERMTRESGLHRALERNEFFLEYQPKIDTQSGITCGMEALLRWRPTAHGNLVSPNEFIPILEETGMIVEVGSWVLETACRQHLIWQQAGMADLVVSVNISAVQFHAGNLPETVTKIIHQTGINPALLCLELTESVVMQDIEQTIATLYQLRELGVKLSIDDFGTGYSSLNYLQRLPLDELKIDRSFVMNLPQDESAIAIVDSVLSLANSLHLTVVAEGVETHEQATFLTKRQCHQLQGYLFSRPLDIDAFAAYADFSYRSPQ
ncbi:MAG: EAL domain-containing protein [Geobacteraceae bacterium]|nr:EAL domain-containing protein [Geobacteraceae bacterium]